MAYSTIYYIVPTLGGDGYDAEQTAQQATSEFSRKVAANTSFDHSSFDLKEHPPAPLGSPTGKEYIEDALERTQTKVESAIETLGNIFNETDDTEIPDWEMLLNEDGLNYAAFNIGQDRGTATFLYDHFGWGIRTNEQLKEYLNSVEQRGHYTPEDTGGEFLAVVPLSAHS